MNQKLIAQFALSLCLSLSVLADNTQKTKEKEQKPIFVSSTGARNSKTENYRKLQRPLRRNALELMTIQRSLSPLYFSFGSSQNIVFFFLLQCCRNKIVTYLFFCTQRIYTAISARRKKCEIFVCLLHIMQRQIKINKKKMFRLFHIIQCASIYSETMILAFFKFAFRCASMKEKSFSRCRFSFIFPSLSLFFRSVR